MGEFSSGESAVVMDVNIVASSLSLLGSLFVVLVYVSFMEIRLSAFRLVVYLEICTFFYSAAVLIGRIEETQTLCTVQAVMISYFGLGSIVWNFIIAYVQYAALLKNTYLENYENKLVIVGFGYPVLWTLLPLSTGSYGRTDLGVCWISLSPNTTSGNAWQMVQFYIPLWISFICILYFYKRVRVISRGLLRQFTEPDSENIRKAKLVSRLKYYPILLIINWLPASINRFALFGAEEDPVLGLYVIHVLFGSLNGLCNAIVFGLDRNVKRAVKGSCAPSLPCISVEDDLDIREPEVEMQQHNQI
jgi:hypothetical protein